MLSIVIPCYNESGDLILLYNEILKSFSQVENLEVIFVDDGSDQPISLSKFKELDQARLSNCKIIKNAENRGYGYSLKRAILQAKNDWIGFVDSDNSYQISDLKVLFNLAVTGDYEMVIGVRGGRFYKGSPLKIALRFLLRRLAEYMCGRRVPDINSGIRILRKNAFLPFFRLTSNRFSFTTSLTLIAHQNLMNCLYSDVQYNKRRGHSHVKLWRDGLTAVGQILAISTYSNPLRVGFLFSNLSMLALVLGTTLSILASSIIYLIVSMSLTMTLIMILLGLFTHSLKDWLNR